jgi:hypothetical protein
MKNEHLARWFMKRRGVSFEKACQMADAVVIRKKEQAAKMKGKLERSQLTMDFDTGATSEEPADRYVPDDPTVNF